MYGSVVLLPLIFAKFFETAPVFSSPIANYQLPIVNYQLEIVPHDCQKVRGLLAFLLQEEETFETMALPGNFSKRYVPQVEAEKAQTVLPQLEAKFEKSGKNRETTAFALSLKSATYSSK